MLTTANGDVMSSPFILLSHQRTGSTLLTSYLLSHPDIFVWFEPFNGHLHQRFVPPRRVTKHAERLLNDPVSVLRTDYPSYSLPSNVERPTLSDDRALAAVGMKHHFHHTRHNRAFYQWIRHQLINVVVVTRGNPVDAIVSFMVARYRKTWFNQPVTKDTLEVDAMEFLGRLSAMITDEEWSLAYFHGAHHVTFDPSSRNDPPFRFGLWHGQEAMHHLADVLGAEPRDLSNSWGLRRQRRYQSPGDVIANWDSVAKILNDHGYGEYL